MNHGGGGHHNNNGGGHQGSGGHGGQRHPSPSPQWFWGGQSSSSSSSSSKACKKAMKRACKGKTGRKCMECAKTKRNTLISSCPGGASTMRKACQKDEVVVVHGLRH